MTLTFDMFSILEPSDCIIVDFAKTKTNQGGKASKLNPKCVFSNPLRPEMDANFVLGMYLASKNTRAKNQTKIFPGGRGGKNSSKVFETFFKSVVAKGHQVLEVLGVKYTYSNALNILGHGLGCNFGLPEKQ